MLTNLKFALFCLLFLSITSCSSDDEQPVYYGETTGDYLPLVQENTWRYFDGTDEHVVVISWPTNFNNEPYFKLFDSSNPYNIQTWIAKRGASYLQRTSESLHSLPGGGAVSIGEHEIVILRDDLAVGQTWQGTPSFVIEASNGGGSQNIPASLSYTGTMLARDVTVDVNGETYTNVIKARLQIVEEVNGQVTNIETEYWFAKDIGIIRESITSSTDNATFTRYLTSYTLN